MQTLPMGPGPLTQFNVSLLEYFVLACTLPPESPPMIQRDFAKTCVQGWLLLYEHTILSLVLRGHDPMSLYTQLKHRLHWHDLSHQVVPPRFPSSERR